ncbi:double zinc ribbon and ankyrin repeat-containing protein 1 isoform X1 [Takifugu rubripes]|uniref:double zinc ribbon and ankyrin repeat-containing protein 1 isoform X1 n=2 Tax=Takifugu rubripes TaxID=31033 RepID=UPI0005D23BE9|nr:double zinc ribbon and ankyrin repeat-containing protein 1 isoform X1 [Takifugu rubripes]XP_029706600.1 double zinc ribbon and ankyrin repeat-containing protein 1 isoform X1 [Takifugu rubripes]|eukprot:XP_011610999.1 PREDICTED: double zinc ribbon and ankyrin repeat-containing protein 1 isoform X2 [Takifugu rubripes]
MTAGVVSAPFIIANSSLHTHGSRRDIDTDTPVFIQSDTPGVLIFYTLDGSKPDMVQCGSAARVRKYSKPIRLPAGRVTVRAIAVTSDGRESSIVTKMFMVQNRDSNKKEKDVLLTNEQAEVQKSSETRSEKSPTAFDSRTCMQPYQPSVPAEALNNLCEEPPYSAGFSELWTRGDVSFKSLTAAAQNGSQFKNSDPLMQASRTKMSGLSQESKYLQDKEVITNLLRCAHCLSARPSDQFSRFCPNCGAEVSEQRLSPTVVEEEHRVCSCCGSGNPINMSSCLTCESYMQPVVCSSNTLSGLTAGRRWCCSICKWLNHHKSRFCSCCGSEATPLSECTWNMATPTAEKSTQTVGLYYPSATQMQRERERALLLSRQSVADRHPPMTSISPGKGYWQRQLDHVCAHLRSYTQNNTPFKALLGDPCMGELVSAVVQEDHQHLTLTMSFALAGQGKKQGNAAGEGVEPSVLPAGGNSLRSDPLPAGTRSSTHKQMQSPQLQVKDAQLMKELGPGRGQCSIVQQLLDQGADPTCCHSNDRHALAVAVLNGHHQVLPVLVQQGANIDQQSGPMKNSALHEAAALGPEGLQCAQVLLSCGAKVRRKNASGQTAFDLAVNSGCNNMVALLAAQIGLSLLDRLAKQK